MKRISVLLACVLSMATALPVQAHGFGHGGYYGGYHGGGYYHGGGGWRGGWVAPLVGGAILGGALYAATTPTYAAPVIVTSPAVPASPRVAYFCSTSQQYYPNVPTCAVPWQLVSY